MSLPECYVYGLVNSKRQFLYVGSTNDLERWLHEHNAGIGKSTKPYRPLDIAAYVAVRTERQARILEKCFKTGS